jgi:hypothetical protein
MPTVLLFTHNEHRLHNLAEYQTLLEWLDERRDLLQRLLYFTDLFHKSIRQWNAAVRREDTVRIIHYGKQHGENRQHVEILERNVTEHQKRVPSVALLPEKTGTRDAQAHPNEDELGRSLADLFNRLNINESEETSQPASHQPASHPVKSHKNKEDRRAKVAQNERAEAAKVKRAKEAKKRSEETRARKAATKIEIVQARKAAENVKTQKRNETIRMRREANLPCPHQHKTRQLRELREPQESWDTAEPRSRSQANLRVTIKIESPIE